MTGFPVPCEVRSTLGQTGDDSRRSGYQLVVLGSKWVVAWGGIYSVLHGAVRNRAEGRRGRVKYLE
jgi:hypothetical protein